MHGNNEFESFLHTKTIYLGQRINVLATRSHICSFLRFRERTSKKPVPSRKSSFTSTFIDSKQFLNFSFDFHLPYCLANMARRLFFVGGAKFLNFLSCPRNKFPFCVLSIFPLWWSLPLSSVGAKTMSRGYILWRLCLVELHLTVEGKFHPLEVSLCSYFLSFLESDLKGVSRIRIVYYSSCVVSGRCHSEVRL